MSIHQDYFPILYSLNIHPEKRDALFLEYKNSLLLSVSALENAQEFVTTLEGIKTLPEFDLLLRELSRYDISPSVNTDISNLRQRMYEDVMQTPTELRNDEIVYRVGTFLKYFISQNHKRVFEDSLLTSFDSYIYDENPEIIEQRFQKL
jgi:hypothetical protein